MIKIASAGSGNAKSSSMEPYQDQEKLQVLQLIYPNKEQHPGVLAAK